MKKKTEIRKEIEEWVLYAIVSVNQTKGLEEATNQLMALFQSKGECGCNEQLRQWCEKHFYEMYGVKEPKCKFDIKKFEGGGACTNGNHKHKTLNETKGNS